MREVAPPAHRNEVWLVGKVTQAPQLRSLPSGGLLATWRIAVRRDDPPPVRPVSDPLYCVSFASDVCGRVRDWRVGDTVEVIGAIRRRFLRRGSGAAVSFEIEAADVALLSRREDY